MTLDMTFSTTKEAASFLNYLTEVFERKVSKVKECRDRPRWP